jgi:hypothetical protein
VQWFETPKHFHSISDGFDIVVNDCYAHNGANKKIQLIDHHGCPVDDKLISKFQGTWGMTNNMYDTLIYAHMKTFRFTGTPALYIECDIRMCHGKCPVILTLNIVVPLLITNCLRESEHTCVKMNIKLLLQV